jgi:hypothetical protein
MLKHNPVLAQSILLTQVQNVYTGLLEAYPNNGLKEQLATGSRYNGNGKVEAYLAYYPDRAASEKSIDLTLTLQCRENKAMFRSEIAWSDGKVIDDVVVCNMCPECIDELGEKVGQVTSSIQGELIDRMVELLGNFQHA